MFCAAGRPVQRGVFWRERPFQPGCIPLCVVVPCGPPPGQLPAAGCARVLPLRALGPLALAPAGGWGCSLPGSHRRTARTPRCGGAAGRPPEGHAATAGLQCPATGCALLVPCFCRNNHSSQCCDVEKLSESELFQLGCRLGSGHA